MSHTHTHRASEHKYATSTENKSHEMRMERNETEAQYQTVAYIHTHTHIHSFTRQLLPTATHHPTLPFPPSHERGALIQAATTSLKNPTTVESRKGNGIPLRKKKDGEWKRGEDTQPETCRRQKRRSLKTGEQNKYNSNNNSNSNCVS